MKKKLFFLLVFFLFLGLVATVQPTEAKKNVSPGSVIKGKGLSTLYFLGEDGKRYVYPNSKTYFSWHENFGGVIEIDMDDLQEYPLGGNVRYKPGTLLIKITTDPKVYAVGKNGMLRWVKTEQLARKLYGDKWNLLVDDIPDSFFVNYSIGDSIESEGDFDPDEEEDDTESVNYNRGLKARINKAKAVKTAKQKRCEWLNKAVLKIQKRMNRWGIEAGEIGEDFLSECAETEIPAASNGKVTLCHIPKGDPGAAKTISVGYPAARAHLAHGDTLGECAIEPEAVCGDGTVDDGEECDDGNTEDGDGCDELCVVETTSAVCGDGTVDEGEECDDSNTEDGDGCSASCTNEPACGDGTVDEGEECDDGNTENDDGCDELCVLEATTTPAVCGDGTVDEGEECDDGNTENDDGCDELCVLEATTTPAVCGDGTVDEGEECDDSNTEDGDGCSASCTDEPACGDGTVDEGEECDDGNTEDGDGCDALCQNEPVCGDGTVDEGEECDDSNTENGDGCDETCNNEVS